MARTPNHKRILSGLVRDMSSTAAAGLATFLTEALANADADDISDVDSGTTTRKRRAKAAPAKAAPVKRRRRAAEEEEAPAKPARRKRAAAAVEEDEDEAPAPRKRRASTKAAEPAPAKRVRRPKVEGFDAEVTDDDVSAFIDEFETENLPAGGVRELTAALAKYNMVDQLANIEGTRKERAEEMGQLLVLAQTLEAKFKATDEDALATLAEELDIDPDLPLAKLVKELTIAYLGDEAEDDEDDAEDEEDGDDEEEDEDEADDEEDEEEEPAPRKRRAAKPAPAKSKRRAKAEPEEDEDEADDDLDDLDDIEDIE